MANIWFIALLSNALLFVACAQHVLDAVTKYENEQCLTKMGSCTLKKVGQTVLQPGPKGDKGSAGATGEKGEIGSPGPIGEPGLPGDHGIPGKPGREGKKGNRGPDGATGQKGDRGTEGDRGIPGLVGIPGEQGEKGSTGPQGPQGLPGIMGTCPCHRMDKKSGDEGDIDETIGSATFPANDVCRFINDDVEGLCFMGPTKMQVQCVNKDGKLWTCIQPQVRRGPQGEIYEKESFWLSSKNISILDLYNLTYIELAWIQEQSTEAKQTLRYHCKKSAPYIATDKEHSLLMLSWNDITFGPTPTKSTPFVYNVPPATDYCQFPPAGKEEKARYSEIELKSDSPRRLPVVDFLVRDLRDKLDDIGVEHMELCFY